MLLAGPVIPYACCILGDETTSHRNGHWTGLRVDTGQDTECGFLRPGLCHCRRGKQSFRQSHLAQGPRHLGCLAPQAVFSDELEDSTA